MQERIEKDFFSRVYEVVRKIPRGRVTSYGAIADFLGTGLSARMVGWAMNSSSSSSLPVPAHRVVNRSGLLTGKHHFGTPTLMQELLEAEGLKVRNDQILDFEKKFWDPARELPAKRKKTFLKEIPSKPYKKQGRHKR